MKLVRILVHLSILCYFLTTKQIAKRLGAYLQNKNSDETSLRLLIESGKMDGFFSTTEIEDIFSHLSSQYPDFVTKVPIGKSFLKHTIYAYKLRSSPNSDLRKSKVLFTGLHHARELITANMIVKIFIETLHSLIHNTSRFSFWNFCDLLIIPVVNVDSHYFISEAFGTPRFKPNHEKRKNMNFNFCSEGSVIDQGVDLNRNYGFHYGEDAIDNGQCSETYRGPNAFSESETQAVRSFIENEKHIISAMNFHAFGNMWIHPFNYMKVKNEFPKNIIQSVVDFYKDFGNEIKNVSKSLYGNAIETVEYSTDGEASDWMLGEHGIIAFSPELGSFNPEAQDFVIPRNLIYSVIQENFKVIELFLKKNSFLIQDLSYGFANTGVFFISFVNKGLADVFNPTLKIERTPVNDEIIRAIKEINVEVKPFVYENGKIELTDQYLVINFAKLSRLEYQKLFFHFGSVDISKRSFDFQLSLKMESGYEIGSFGVSHEGLSQKKDLILGFYGALFTLIGIIVIFGIIKIAKLLKKEPLRLDPKTASYVN